MKPYKDKIYHAIISCAIVLAVATFFSLNLGIFIALVFAFGKELYDKYVKLTEFSWWDIIADLIGIVVGVLIWEI